MANTDVIRAPLNRTLTLSDEELTTYRTRLERLELQASVGEVRDRVFCQDVFEALPKLPDESVDLLFADPPYNLTKNFNQRTFKKI